MSPCRDPHLSLSLSRRTRGRPSNKIRDCTGTETGQIDDEGQSSEIGVGADDTHRCRSRANLSNPNGMQIKTVSQSVF